MPEHRTRWRYAAAFGLLLHGLASAGNADVLEARADCDARRVCSFTVTVRHADSGWDHYANAWRIVGPDGAVLATRTLLHPHVDEQPFTRSLSGVVIPGGVRGVTIEAVDSVHGAAGRPYRLVLDLPAPL